MGDHFVGYHEKINIPSSFKSISYAENCDIQKTREILFEFISSPTLLSRWFVDIQSMELKQGGSIKFFDFDGKEKIAVCTSVTLGSHVTYISDSFGEMSISVSDRKANFKFSILTDNGEAYLLRIKNYISNFIRVVSP